MNNEELALLALQKTRIRMLQDYFFFGNLVLGLNLVHDYSIPTLSTDGEEIRFNPDFILSKDKHFRLFALLHEIGHVINLHHKRFKPGMDQVIYNMAADYVVNDLLFSLDGLKLPEEVLYDEKYKNHTV